VTWKVFLLTASLLALVCALPCQARDSDFWERVSAKGHIDWTANKALARGFGVPPAGFRDLARSEALARRAAVIDARRNLLEVVGELRIDSRTKVKNYMTASDEITTRISGIVLGSRVESEHRFEDGSYTVVVSMPLTGRLSRAVLQSGTEVTGPQTPTPNTGLSPAPAENGTETLNHSLAPEDSRPLELDLQDEQAGEPAKTAETPPIADYTGLVIDARDTGFKPSLAPRIVGPEGLIYPGPGVDGREIAERGPVRYYRDLSLAQSSERAGSRPLTLEAGPGAQATDLELSPADAGLLRRMAENGNYLLSDLRVVVVF
jgi:hypothetical protein